MTRGSSRTFLRWIATRRTILAACLLKVWISWAQAVRVVWRNLSLLLGKGAICPLAFRGLQSVAKRAEKREKKAGFAGRKKRICRKRKNNTGVEFVTYVCRVLFASYLQITFAEEPLFLVWCCRGWKLGVGLIWGQIILISGWVVW